MSSKDTMGHCDIIIRLEVNGKKRRRNEEKATPSGGEEEDEEAKREQQSRERQPGEREPTISEQERDLRERASDHSLRYCGHCNTTTDIKEANFLGRCEDAALLSGLSAAPLCL